MDENSTMSLQHYLDTYNISWTDIDEVMHSKFQIEFYVGFWLVTVAVLSLASLGVVGNLVCLVVWGMDTSFNATIFLFRYLAMWDSGFLVMVIVFEVFPNNWAYTYSAAIWGVWHVGNFVQMVAVQVTLLIAVSRWVAVVFPLHAAHLVTARRIYLSCLLIFLFCALLEAAQVVYSYYYIVNIVKRAVALALPLLLLLIFNVSLLWTISRRSKDLQRIQMRELPAQRKGDSRGKCVRSSETSDTSAVSLKDIAHQAIPLSSGTQVAGNNDEERQHRPLEQQQEQQQQQNREQRPVRKNRVQEVQGPARRHPVEKAVLLISLCTFIAYPVGNSLQIYAILEAPHLSLLMYTILVYSAFLCQILNSGVNVLIYWFCMSRFRQLAARLRSRLSNRLPCGSGARVPSPAPSARPSVP